MKKIVVGITMLLLLLTTLTAVTEARLAANARRAVVLEAFYALRRSYDGGCDKTIPTTNGRCVSNWNYIASDTCAYSVVKSWYGKFSSEWTTPNDGSNYVGVYHYVSFYNNVGSYGYGTFGGSYGPVGRGGECKYFVNLILYRSGTYQTNLLFPHSAMWNNATNDFSAVKEGDVIVTLASESRADFDHTVIVVEIKRSNGVITGLDVIDANWVSDTGATFREVIGRHLFQISYARQYYRIWKGTPYYNCGYDPNGSNPNPTANPLCK